MSSIIRLIDVKYIHIELECLAVCPLKLYKKKDIIIQRSVMPMEQELDYTAIGDRIRRYRELSRMTQEQLSELCSLSTGYIGHLERGTRSPSFETLARISQILRVSLDDLVFGEAEISNNMIKILALTLEDKNPEKVKVFLKTVCALADKIDEF